MTRKTITAIETTPPRRGLCRSGDVDSSGNANTDCSTTSRAIPESTEVCGCCRIRPESLEAMGCGRQGEVVNATSDNSRGLSCDALRGFPPDTAGSRALCTTHHQHRRHVCTTPQLPPRCWRPRLRGSLAQRGSHGATVRSEAGVSLRGRKTDDDGSPNEAGPRRRPLVC